MDGDCENGILLFLGLLASELCLESRVVLILGNTPRAVALRRTASSRTYVKATGSARGKGGGGGMQGYAGARPAKGRVSAEILRGECRSQVHWPAGHQERGQLQVLPGLRRWPPGRECLARVSESGRAQT